MAKTVFRPWFRRVHLTKTQPAAIAVLTVAAAAPSGRIMSSLAAAGGLAGAGGIAGQGGGLAG